jgi:GTP-binding protein
MAIASTVVFVGRMNVGKSTLFNRLSVNVKSITLDYEGVTRDFVKDTLVWQERSFTLIDSGGIHLRKSKDPLFEKIRQKVLQLIDESDGIVFVVDGTTGVLPEDREISRFLHKTGKPVIVAVNKIDSRQAQEHIYEFERLGHQAVIGISAQHGIGIHDLLDVLIRYVPVTTRKQEITEPTYKVVLLGKPNVGKSSLMNYILKEERSLVSDIPGTTREAISERITFYKEQIEVTDTPGIRRKRAVSGQLEPLMIKSSFHALKQADIIVLLIDGSSGALVDQELKLAFYAFTEHYKALILAINKQDLMTDADKRELDVHFDCYKHLIERVPVLYISCKTGKNVGRLVPLVHTIGTRYTQQFDDAALQALFISALQKTPLYRTGEQLRVYKVSQVKTGPITIALTVNEPQWFGPAQLTFFENILRASYELTGVPIKFIVKKAA